MKLEKFHNTDYQEQETNMLIDYAESVFRIYTSKRNIYNRLLKIAENPTITYYIGKEISGAEWIIPFRKKVLITKILSRPTLIGNIK